MGLFGELRRALWGSEGEPAVGATSTDAVEPLPSPQRKSDFARTEGPAPEELVQRRQERAAERLLEDERLRGDLTDDEFEPLLQWALAASDQISAATAGLAEPEAERAIADGLETIRAVLVTAARTVAADRESGRPPQAAVQELVEHIRPLVVNAAGTAGVRARLTRALARIASPAAPEGSAALAAELASALRSVTLEREDRAR